jgi:lipopolysaccharide heptosyltransferase I
LKVLLLKPSSLGDVVQALPVLRLLKKHWPASEIYWWLAADLAPLLEGDPDLSGIIRFERDRWRAPWRWHELFASLRRVREKRFDLVIDLQGLIRSGLFAWVAQGELTIGLDDPREGAVLFYDRVVRQPEGRRHAVDWYLEVVHQLHVPVTWDFVWLPPRVEVAQAVQRKWQPAGYRWLVLIPGARWPTKRWPVEHFAHVVCQLATSHRELRFVILGGREDTGLGRTIAQAAPARCLDLTGRTSLPEMVEWVRLGEVVVTNDTGPMHVAAALGKPVVALFGPTDPRRTGPYGQLARALQVKLPCVPCLKSTCAYQEPLACLRQLAPGDVVQMLAAELQQREAPSSGVSQVG